MVLSTASVISTIRRWMQYSIRILRYLQIGSVRHPQTPHPHTECRSRGGRNTNLGLTRSETEPGNHRSSAEHSTDSAIGPVQHERKTTLILPNISKNCKKIQKCLEYACTMLEQNPFVMYLDRGVNDSLIGIQIENQVEIHRPLAHSRPTSYTIAHLGNVLLVTHAKDYIHMTPFLM